MDSTGKIILGVLAGVAAGAALGILFAPDKGSVTRGRIADSARDLGSRIKTGTEDFIHETGAKVKHKMESFSEKGNKAMS